MKTSLPRFDIAAVASDRITPTSPVSFHKEKAMLKKIFFAGAASMIAVSAHAITANDIKESVGLKDGTTVHVFNDGKMGMEDRYGRAFQMPEGHVMQAADGRTITMVGNEVARVAVLNTIAP